MHISINGLLECVFGAEKQKRERERIGRERERERIENWERDWGALLADGMSLKRGSPFYIYIFACISATV